jgi:hypothetical protein
MNKHHSVTTFCVVNFNDDHSTLAITDWIFSNLGQSIETVLALAT